MNMCLMVMGGIKEKEETMIVTKLCCSKTNYINTSCNNNHVNICLLQGNTEQHQLTLIGHFCGAMNEEVGTREVVDYGVAQKTVYRRGSTKLRISEFNQNF